MHQPAGILGIAVVVAAAWTTGAQAAPADVSCDGAVDGQDVAAFVLAVVAPSAYAAAYPGCPSGNGDFDCDGDADADDISGFVDCLLTGHCQACPPTGMVAVPGGESLMGDFRHEGAANERPAHAVFLAAYFIDLHEVTSRQYADGLNWALAQGGLVAVVNGVVYRADSGTGYPYCDTTSSDAYSRITWSGAEFGVVAGKGDHPMVMVSWYGAAAYCNWRSIMQGREPCFDLSTWACDFTKDGYRLPTEAEWEKAASWDPVHQRTFRFSELTDGCGVNCLNGNRANYTSSGDPFEAGQWPPTTPVGFYDGGSHDGYQTQDARSYYGCRDMSGNAWEWCYDWFSATYYSVSPSTDPTGPASGTDRVQRGGSWYNVPYACRATVRNYFTPGDRFPTDGFRCAAGSP